MKTGDWLKLSIFALVGVVISLVILGLNSANNSRKINQNAYGNNPMDMQGYSNAAPQENQMKARQVNKKNENPGNMPMQGGNGYTFNSTSGEYSQTNYLPSQLAAMNYQMVNNDLYLQKEIAAIQQHDARLHDEVQELQTQYGQLKQGLNSVYASFNSQGQTNTIQNTGGLYGNNPAQYQQTSMGGIRNMNPTQNSNYGYNTPAQYQQAGMGGTGGMNPAQNSNFGYNTPAQYQQTSMGGNRNMNPMQNSNFGYNTPAQYQQTGMGGGNGGMNPMQNQSGMGGGMGMNMDVDMMNNMMGMMNNMMGMMSNMQSPGNSSGSSSSGGMSSGGSGGSTGSGGGMSSGGSGGGMSMM